MTFDVICVESMQWNRSAPVEMLELSGQDTTEDTTDQPTQISPEIMAEVQAAISAEVAKTAS
jgi:hypothetical protein